VLFPPLYNQEGNSTCSGNTMLHQWSAIDHRALAIATFSNHNT